MQSNILKVTLLAVSMGLIGGCADTAKMAEVESMASAAMEKANDAYSLAQTANTTASEAAYAASEANDKATAALECCNANSQKLDRMFQKAMMK